MLSSNDDPQKRDLKHNLNDIKSTMNLKSYKYPFKIRLKILKDWPLFTIRIILYFC